MNIFRKILIVSVLVLAVSTLFYCKISSVDACNTITGTAGPDVLNGSNICDIINGKAGDDIIKGWDGDDNVDGDFGNDEIWGGCGADTLQGGPQFDIIHFNANEGDSVFLGLGGGDARCPDTTCAGGTCMYDFRIRYDMLPANTGNVSQIIGDTETTDIVAFQCDNKVQNLEGLEPGTTYTRYFAAEGFSEATGLPEIPSADHMAAQYGNYSVKQDTEHEGVLIVEIPAYTKEESSIAASELFIPDGDSHIMFDHNSNVEIILHDIEYVRFNGTALIPVQ